MEHKDNLLEEILNSVSPKTEEDSAKINNVLSKPIQFSNMQIDPNSLQKVKNVFEKARIRVKDDIPRPVPVMKLGGTTIGSLADMTTWTGKAKSRKSYFLSAILTAALNPEYYKSNLEVLLPLERNGIIWIDTEQSDFWSQQILMRVKWSGVADEIIDERIYYYNCRSFSSKEIIAFVYWALEQHKNHASICIIDGSRDLVDSINDEVEARNLSRWIPELGKHYNMHMSTVLHQNPGGGDGSKVRGTLGTEFMNKSEYIVELKRHMQDKEISIVSSMMGRGVESEELCFTVEDHLLKFVDAPVDPKTEKSKFLYDLQIADLKHIVKTSFGLKDKLSQMKLKVAIKENLHNNYHMTMGVQKIVEEWIPFLENKGLIELANDEITNGKAKIYLKTDFTDIPVSDEEDIPF